MGFVKKNTKLKVNKKKERFSVYLDQEEGPAALLETLEEKSIKERKKRSEELVQYHWDYYSYFVSQRNKIIPLLKEALIKNSENTFAFDNWNRCFTFKYAMNPLSARGSINSIGGRFNIGMDLNDTLNYFPALYIAKEQTTALLEKKAILIDQGGNPDDMLKKALSGGSFGMVSVSGVLEKCLNLKDIRVLSDFLNLIKGTKLSNELVERAKELGLPKPKAVNTLIQLQKSIFYPKWRTMSVLSDYPANSQIIGHIAASAGITGILYPSTKDGSDCLAIFPKNFKDTDSFVEISDEYPESIEYHRMESSNFHNFY
ncbi:MAG: hypothetical protein A2381_18675 [Bdellovibrionales bacterium RIFOXYB1_FULL_37_110]|nr:MAG: hypothetical protein A2417_18225 [Bdellovibrionales bacterium RIFOXYC1_FULL_37_79]OFZ58313.1 MAG: hypothetical protein A2381_18675 [Bdellovibrionales bacterium RIFOXYB1_FULL_37_110]